MKYKRLKEGGRGMQEERHGEEGRRDGGGNLKLSTRDGSWERGRVEIGGEGTHARLARGDAFTAGGGGGCIGRDGLVGAPGRVGRLS